MSYEEIKKGLQEVINDPEKTEAYISELRKKGIALSVTSITNYNDPPVKTPTISITLSR